MNKRKLLNFFLMNQDTGAGAGGAAGGAEGGTSGAAGAAGAAGAEGGADGQGAGSAAGAAGAGGGAGTQGAQTDPSPTNWLQSLPDAEAKAYAESKGWKDPGDAVKAIRELEGKYAVPDKADAYQLPVPQGQDGAFAKQASEWMLKAGIPVAQAQALTAEWNTHMAAQESARQAEIAKDMSSLKTEWGTEYDANVELGRRVMRNFGVDGAAIDRIAGQMGDAATLRVFQRIGKGLSEGTLGPGGGSGSGNADPIDADKARAARMFPSMQPKS